VLSASVRLLHPYLPFLTEEIWSHLPGSRGALLVADWPDASDFAADPSAEADFERLRDTVSAVRNIRSAMNVPPGTLLRVLVHSDDPDLARVLASSRELVQSLARIGELTAGADVTKPRGSASGVVRGGTVWVPLEGVIDLSVERERLRKESERLRNLIEGTEHKLANADFVARAKPEVVEREREKLESLRGDRDRVAAALADLA
jgi:valyl-tRNA synthetase